MSDFVDQLRESADHCASLTQGATDPLIRQVARAEILMLRGAADEIERLRVALRNIRAKSDQMAEDDGVWFGAATAAEAYLQQELRKLCAVIEGMSPDECARAAYDSGVAKDGLAVKLPMRRPHG